MGFRGGGAKPCLKKSARIIKSYANDMKLTTNYYQKFKAKVGGRGGGGVKGFLNYAKKLQDWYIGASLTLISPSLQSSSSSPSFNVSVLGQSLFPSHT